MIVELGQLVEYERQPGQPPVIASVVEIHPDDTATVRARLIVDEHGVVLHKFNTHSSIRLANELLKSARRFELDPMADYGSFWCHQDPVRAALFIADLRIALDECVRSLIFDCRVADPLFDPNKSPPDTTIGKALLVLQRAA